MTKKLLRPTEIQERIDKIEKELTELFSRIEKEKKLDFTRTALIPLSRRGLGLLPTTERSLDGGSSLVSTLERFGYIEEYPLFPQEEGILPFDTIILFDDVCVEGTHLKDYELYLKRLDRRMENKDIIWATYLMKRGIAEKIRSDYKNEEKIYAAKVADEEEFRHEIPRIFEFITCRGEIIDPDHMFIKIKFKKRRKFFDLWDDLKSIAEKNSCNLIEDGISFLHPSKEKLALFVEGKNKKEILESLGLSFPEFVNKIEIAKFRMVFDIELSENIEDHVSTTGFIAVPILNPRIEWHKFQSMACRNWGVRPEFCKEGSTIEGGCGKKWKPKAEFAGVKLMEEYYSPWYDCIVYNLVKTFSDYFLKEILKLLEEDVDLLEEKWLHIERLNFVENVLSYQ